MTPPTQLSQRNPQWKDEYLGYSNVTIEFFGCTITALAMLARFQDVRSVNNLLIDEEGFAQGNLVIWNKVSLIPRLKFNYRYYYYDNNKVLAIIQKNGACLVEVDGTPIGGERHWLLYIGSGKLLDPWDGKIKSTSSYKAISFVDIDYTGIEEPFDSTSEEEGNNMSELEDVLKFVGVKTLQELKDKWNQEVNINLVADRKRKAELEKEVSQLEGDLKQLREHSSELEHLLKQANEQSPVNTAENDSLPTSINIKGKTYTIKEYVILPNKEV